ncbi:hypothetical protein TrCOL_g275 [Triparma columacea]|uniref:tRNA-intron lyase n=1 Tax=Triparma columacea TaxID=722753 RepID=A0A9W7G5M5_9STRA|nr:hypothetical protein TrCOL_g275 [Triparma columacea]
METEVENLRLQYESGSGGSDIKFKYMKAKAVLTKRLKLLKEVEDVGGVHEGMGFNDHYDRNRVLPVVVGREAVMDVLGVDEVRDKVGGLSTLIQTYLQDKDTDEGDGYYERDSRYEEECLKKAQRMMEEAEILRVGEKGVRELPYTVKFERWTRFIEGREGGGNEEEEGGGEEKEGEEGMMISDPSKASPQFPTSTTSKGIHLGAELFKEPLSSSDFLPLPLPPPPTLSSHVNPLPPVYSYLHTTLNLHVGCGSKFGCDYLVYDGDREVRHAFAGVRVVPEGGSIEIGDVTGWVRAMNKAGKIAVLCYVENERGRRGRRRMGFVDSVLEKREIVKWKGKKKRKVMGGENLKKV